MKAKICLILVVFFAGFAHGVPLGTAFTYQGELKHMGAPANGPFDFEFHAYDVATSGIAVAGPLQLDDVDVVDGVFTVELDFGAGTFGADQLWLAIGVREGASPGGYTGLLPRQKITAVPYSLHALDDADTDPGNEIQDLALSADTLSLSGDPTSVDLSAYLDNTDAQTLAQVLGEGNDAGGQSLVNVQNLSATDTTTTNALTIAGLDCSANANGGTLTANASGVVSCTDDDFVSANTLDGAYDQGGAGAGRTITADSGAVIIEGTGGLTLDGGDLLQLPGNPVLAGSLPIGTNPVSVDVSGRYAYVVDDASNELVVIDVSEPSMPSQVGSLGLGGSPQSVAVSGRYAYVVDSTSDDLKVIDLSDPSSPNVAGSLGIGGIPVSVVVSGRYAFVVDTESDDLKVIDVSDPSAPTLAGSLGLGTIPQSVVVSGRYAYVIDQNSDDLKLIDVSDPSMPAQTGNLGIGGSPQSVAVSGRYAYVVDGTSSDLKVIDVSDPGVPSQTGSLPVGANPVSVFVSGRYAYVVDAISDDLRVIDVSDPSMPSLAGSLGLGQAARSVVVSGRYAYVVDEGSDDLKVIDISGAEVTSLEAHSLEAGNLQVRDDIVAQGQLQVTGGVNVGSGGLFSDGDAGFGSNLSVDGTVFLSNDTAPTSSPANGVQLYAEDVATSSELMVRDEAGNITTLSPHNFSLIGEPSEPMAWSFYSENGHGKINVDMLRTVRAVERISGETLVQVELKGDDRALAEMKVTEGQSAGHREARSASHSALIAYIEALQAQNRALERRVAALEGRLN